MGTKDDILRILEENRNTFVSGADIAKQLGLSGTAVWKAVRKLKNEGFHIESVTNKGYMLSPDSDILSERVIKLCIENSELGRIIKNDVSIEAFESIDSTNNVCKDRAASGGTDGFVAVAANQTKGRGRRGRNFFSPDNTGLYLSILLRPEGYNAQQSLRFTTIAAVAVAESIEQVSGKKTDIKWVNDIFMNDHKVCGILTEASFDLESGSLDYAVVGIGINLFTPEGGFPEEIRNVAGAVFDPYDQPGADIRSRLAAEVITRFMAYYKGLVPGRYIDQYRKRCFILGRDINVLKAGAEPRRAHAIDIDDECGLIVKYEDGNCETLNSGEISIRF